MNTIHKSMCSIEGTSVVCEASTIGLRPGEWPEMVAVLDDKNEGFLFGRGLPDLCDGEVAGMRYGQVPPRGMTLLIIND